MKKTMILRPASTPHVHQNGLLPAEEKERKGDGMLHLLKRVIGPANPMIQANAVMMIMKVVVLGLLEEDHGRAVVGPPARGGLLVWRGLRGPHSLTAPAVSTTH